MQIIKESPMFLLALGGAERLEVYRSTLVGTDADLYSTVAEFIRENRLVLLWEDSWPEEGMAGIGNNLIASVFVPPKTREGVMAGTHMSLAWYPDFD